MNLLQIEPVFYKIEATWSQIADKELIAVVGGGSNSWGICAGKLESVHGDMHQGHAWWIAWHVSCFWVRSLATYHTKMTSYIRLEQKNSKEALVPVGEHSFHV